MAGEYLDKSVTIVRERVSNRSRYRAPLQLAVQGEPDIVRSGVNRGEDELLRVYRAPRHVSSQAIRSEEISVQMLAHLKPRRMRESQVS